MSHTATAPASALDRAARIAHRKQKKDRYTKVYNRVKALAFLWMKRHEPDALQRLRLQAKREDRRKHGEEEA